MKLVGRFPSLKSRHQHADGSSNRRGRARRRAVCPPAVELLEDRTVPATLSTLSARAPAGSLLYEATGSGQVTTAGSVDFSSVDLDDGQTLSVVVDYFTWNGHYYTLTNQSESWDAAEAEAVALGGHLVAINDQAEQDFLVRSFLSGS